jgi:hypothetical protein
MESRDPVETRESGVMTEAAEGRCPTCHEPRPDLSVPCPHCGAPALGPAEPAPTAEAAARRDSPSAVMQVRAADLEPYVGLRYVSKLFRLIALILVLLLIAEVVIGLTKEGRDAIPTLLAEGSRLLVLAGLLWGSGDLAILLIDIGHDVRATRILIGRQAAHQLADQHQQRRRDHEREREGDLTSRARSHHET